MIFDIFSTQFRSAVIVTLFTYLCMALGPSRALCQDTGATSEATDEEPTEYMVALNEGDPAPFPGTLLNVPAAARILTDFRLTEESCRIETERRLRILEADMQLRIDTEIARREALQYRHDQLMEIRNQQIEFFTSNFHPPEWHQRGEFWYAMGVISGIAVTILAGYALSLVDSSL